MADAVQVALQQEGGLRRVNRSRVLDATRSPAVRGTLDVLLGTWRSTRGTPLVTMPEAGPAWQVPSSGWHLDHGGGDVDLERRVARLLAFVGPVRVGGGGTCVIVDPIA